MPHPEKAWEKNRNLSLARERAQVMTKTGLERLHRVCPKKQTGPRKLFPLLMDYWTENAPLSLKSRRRAGCGAIVSSLQFPPPNNPEMHSNDETHPLAWA